MNWKLLLDYDFNSKKFLLSINDKPFLMLPFKANATSAEPMNIEDGIIYINNIKAHEGWLLWTEASI